MSVERRWKDFERYVAIGDSSTEGLNDHDPAGGYRGWADRLAERIAAARGDVLYANLGVRGRLTREVRAEQLPAALEMRPDLVSLFVGSNDVLELHFDAARYRDDLAVMQGDLTARGATVIGFTFPDLGPVFSVAHLLQPRLSAMNAAMREASAETGAILVDFARYAVGSDPRLWDEDRFHANALGHERIAWALAHALGLPASGAGWGEPLDERSRPSRATRLMGDLLWGVRYGVEFMQAAITGRRPGHDRQCKRPQLAPIAATDVTATGRVD